MIEWSELSSHIDIAISIMLIYFLLSSGSADAVTGWVAVGIGERGPRRSVRKRSARSPPPFRTSDAPPGSGCGRNDAYAYAYLRRSRSIYIAARAVCVFARTAQLCSLGLVSSTTCHYERETHTNYDNACPTTSSSGRVTGRQYSRIPCCDHSTSRTFRAPPQGHRVPAVPR